MFIKMYYLNFQLDNLNKFMKEMKFSNKKVQQIKLTNEKNRN